MTLSSRCAITVSAVLTLLGSFEAPAQERCKLSWEVPPANSTYTQQYTIDVGDVPGHQIRIFELRRTFPNDKPNCKARSVPRSGTCSSPG